MRGSRGRLASPWHNGRCSGQGLGRTPKTCIVQQEALTPSPSATRGRHAPSRARAVSGASQAPDPAACVAGFGAQGAQIAPEGVTAGGQEPPRAPLCARFWDTHAQTPTRERSQDLPWTISGTRFAGTPTDGRTGATAERPFLGHAFPAPSWGNPLRPLPRSGHTPIFGRFGVSRVCARGAAKIVLTRRGLPSAAAPASGRLASRAFLGQPSTSFAEVDAYAQKWAFRRFQSLRTWGRENRFNETRFAVCGLPDNAQFWDTRTANAQFWATRRSVRPFLGHVLQRTPNLGTRPLRAPNLGRYPSRVARFWDTRAVFRVTAARDRPPACTIPRTVLRLATAHGTPCRLPPAARDFASRARTRPLLTFAPSRA